MRQQAVCVVAVDEHAPPHVPVVGRVRVEHLDDVGADLVAVLDDEHLCRKPGEAVDLVAVLPEHAYHQCDDDLGIIRVVPKDPSLTPSLQEHPALLLSGLASIWVTFRVLRVAHGDVTTAYTILGGAGTGTVAAGVVASIVPYLLVISALVLLHLRVRRRQGVRWWHFGVAAGVGCLTLQPWLLVMGPMLLLVSLAPRLRDWRTKPERLTRLAIAVTSVLTIVTAGFTDDPWMPLERLTVSGSSTVGYVLSTGRDEVLVLREEDRRPVRLSSGPLKREYCRPSADLDLVLTRVVVYGAKWRIPILDRLNGARPHGLGPYADCSLP